MKHFATALLLCLGFTAQAQFRLVSNGIPGWSVVNDSTYTATVSFHADQTGFGYLPLAIADTFRLFTGTEQLYQVVAVENATFFSADLTVTEITNEYTATSGPPIGQVLVFDPGGRETVPQNPFGSTGSTAQLQAATDTYNARVTGTAQPPGNLHFSGAFQGDGTKAAPYGFYNYYINHPDAAGNGVPLGGAYKAQLGNTMGAPWGMLIIRAY